MEGNDYVTTGDLALMNDYRRNDCYGYGRRDNVATTGIGLAAGSPCREDGPLLLQQGSGDAQGL